MKSLIPVLIILIAPISNAFSQQVPASPVSGLFQATEICNNGLDDDGDGLIDCFDGLDCPCDSFPNNCRVDSMPFNFQMKQEWISPQDNIYSASTPIVGNLNPAQDSIPEIVVSTVITSQSTQDWLFYKGDGSDRNNPPRITVQATYTYPVKTDPAIADLDRDGNPELFYVGFDRRIYVYHSFDPAANPPIQLWVTSPQLSGNERNHVYAADFDGDGISELYAGNEVYALDLSNPALPALNQVLMGTGPTGSNSINSSFAADLLSPADCGGDPDCNGLEIAAGYAIYSVDLDPADGDGVQIKIQRNINTSSGQNFSDGFTGVADLNLDGTPEVVVAGSRGGQLGIYAWNKTGYWTFLRSTNPFPGDQPGVFAVANVYDDTELGYAQDWPEILNANSGWLGCFNLHAAAANPVAPLWWTLPTDDLLGYGGLSSFDFDHNGVQELVFKDESNLRILYGGGMPFPPGVGTDRNLSKMSINPVTGFEFPVIADVDGDDQAEIIVTSISDVSSQGDPNFGLLHVFGSNGQNHRSWMPARDIWNQYAYSVVHIEDDLSVPIVQQPGHLEMPAAGSGNRPMNNFSFQAPKYGRADEAYLPTPDLHMELIGNECHGPTFTITLRICNEGSIPFKDSLFITWYRFGNPFSGNAIRGGTFVARTTPLMTDSCMIFTANLPFAPVTFYLLANDAGNTDIPLPGDFTFPTQECEYQNNTIHFNLYPPPVLNLGPDRSGCPPGGHTLITSNGFSTYLWQDGSTGPTFTATMPGIYWLEATDNCHNVRRDTVRVVSGATTQTIQAKVCPGESYTFDGVPVPADSSHTFAYVSVDGCDSIIIVQVSAWQTGAGAETRQICPGDSTLVFGNYVNSAGVFQQVFSDVNGCDSTHTVTVSLFPATPNTQEFRQICPGDSTLVFGNYVTSAGVFQQTTSNANGCDSTHTVTVSLFPAPQNTQEFRQICPGDSTLVFGNYVTVAGIFQQTNSNANGCDSTHIVTVSLFPATPNTQEFRQICPGDSILVFGNHVTSAGVFLQTFSNINGCDSTHTVTVSLFPAPQNTQEFRQICPGDSTLVFGNYVASAGVFQQTISNTNGCDSTHTVTISLFPAPQNSQEFRHICPGDSILVFGNYVTSAGVFQQTFPGANGCDSTHTVTVSLFPAPPNSQETRQICPGDSTLVFGNYVTSAGVFQQIFPGANGCDSIHTVTVSLFSAPQNTQEFRQICPGDSTFVFGNYVTSAGVFQQIFPGPNGCDSTHTVTVSLFPAPQNTQETRQICPGDSTLVFGNYVTSAGVFQQTTSNVNGCDSTHTVTVSLFPAPQNTQETRQICPGDSTLVFGNYVTSAGAFQQTISNTNGCDSTHTITVSLLPAPQNTQESRQICPGDSILVFGNYVTSAGVFQQTASNVNGCDSTHTVEVSVVPASLPELAVTQPGCLDSLGEVTLSGWTTSFTTSLDGVHFGSDTVFQHLLPGSYHLYIEQAGCEDTISFELYAVVAPMVYLPADTVIVAGSSVLLQPAFPAGSAYLFEWSPAQYLSCITCPMPVSTPAESVVYSLVVTDNSGCTATDEIAINVRQSSVYAPNVFRPEANGANAFFTLYADPLWVEKIEHLQVFDRWGDAVFERRNFLPNVPEQGWNGLFRGRNAPAGIYAWHARIVYADGSVEDRTGDVLLLR